MLRYTGLKQGDEWEWKATECRSLSGESPGPHRRRQRSTPCEPIFRNVILYPLFPPARMCTTPLLSSVTRRKNFLLLSLLGRLSNFMLPFFSHGTRRRTYPWFSGKPRRLFFFSFLAYFSSPPNGPLQRYITPVRVGEEIIFFPVRSTETGRQCEFDINWLWFVRWFHGVYIRRGLCLCVSVCAFAVRWATEIGRFFSELLLFLPFIST